MIFIGLGANLDSPLGSPVETLTAALGRLAAHGVTVRRRSRWYRTAPVPVSSQPWYTNAVAEIETALTPAGLLAVLQEIETAMGRVRLVRNEARAIDLDILDWHGTVSAPDAVPILPHPRMHQRAFVLLPLRELAPDWRHPLLGGGIDDLVAGLPIGQVAECLPQ